MKKQSLTRILKIDPESELSYVASAFSDVLKSQIHDIIKQPTNARRDDLEAFVREMYQAFYDHAKKSLIETRDDIGNDQNHPEAENLKQKAQNVQSDFEKLMIEFAVCYLNLHQSMGMFHEALSYMPAPKTGTTGRTEWTRDTERLVGQYHGERDQLIVELEQLTECMTKFIEFAPRLEEFENAVGKLVGSKEKKEALRSVMAGLRLDNFERAKKGLDELLNKKPRLGLTNSRAIMETIQNHGQAYIELVHAYKDHLKGGDGKLFLNAQELGVVVDAKTKDLSKKNAFITKYFRPYLEYRLKSTHLLKDKLGVIGSIDSLVGLYTRMMHGMILPMTEIKDVREYESHIIDNINFLLETKFKEVKNIDEWNAQNIEHFYDSLNGFEISKTLERQNKKKDKA